MAVVKTTKKSDKLVSKATSLFDKAIQRVVKANELLQKQISQHTFDNESDEQAIVSIQNDIQSRHEDIAEKEQKILENQKLIEKFIQFSL